MSVEYEFPYSGIRSDIVEHYEKGHNVTIIGEASIYHKKLFGLIRWHSHDDRIDFVCSCGHEDKITVASVLALIDEYVYMSKRYKIVSKSD